MSFKERKSILRERLSSENVAKSYFLKGSSPREFISYVKTYVPAKPIKKEEKLKPKG